MSRAPVPGIASPEMSRELIDLEEARRIVVESCAPLPAESVPLERALGRGLAQGVVSEVAIPPFDNSAMDGFAVRAADTRLAAEGEPVALRVAGESRAGRPADRPVGSGEAFRISTGAMVPEGADAVLPQEEASERNGAIETQRPVDPGADIRRA